MKLMVIVGNWTESGLQMILTDESIKIYGRTNCRILRENEAGATPRDLAGEHGVSEDTIYA